MDPTREFEHQDKEDHDVDPDRSLKLSRLTKRAHPDVVIETVDLRDITAQMIDIRDEMKILRVLRCNKFHVPERDKERDEQHNPREQQQEARRAVLDTVPLKLALIDAWPNDVFDE